MSSRAPPPDRRPLVVVSNRLPFVVERHGGRVSVRRSSGGLVAALDPVLQQRGGVWIGWPGETVRLEEALADQPPSPVRYAPVPLSDRELTQYYGSFANRTLWPLFHYFVGRTRFDDAAWRTYDRVNARFAQAAAQASGDDALVWVHDYHLLRVPLHLRQLAPHRRVVFFLHIPFPAYDLFRVLPAARPLMRGLLAADLVGFHVPDYAAHFLTCAERLLGCEVDRAAGIVQWEGRAVTVGAFPLGIDVEGIERLAGEVDVAVPAPGQPRTIIGVDRLDYTKGVHERLLAVERLFERHPGYRGKVVFAQLLVPSREFVQEYRSLKRELDETVGRINGRFSDEGWTPIRYLVRSLGPRDLAAFYRTGDVALVTPLRDGMNLVAKEYVAAQLDERGVLILSELAGAAQELQEALLVNPFDVDAMADALDRALSMPEDERRARMAALRDRVHANTLQTWVTQFLQAAERASERARAEAASPAEVVLHRLEPWLRQRPTVALFLDYDGTLTPIVRRPEEALLSDAARDALRQAALTPALDLAIVSGRALTDIRQMVGVPGLTYVGNHGFEIEGPGLNYRLEGLDQYCRAVDAAAGEVEALELPGVRVERKGVTVSVHLREVPREQQEEVERIVAAAFRHQGLRVTRGKAVVEGRPPLDWGKGHAVLHVLRARHGEHWTARVRAIYVGDDVTDEDAFRSLAGIGRSICVGPGPAEGRTLADYHLPDPTAVVQLVRRLAAGAFAERRA
ncbi:MAG TPA: bifunctional alpha,alpha-trehalose-phosphate synthase (UDP-forming)/trehalose-phosphatase [Gemmatimonadales bacterium]|nr:bifunctional alpha,alpha-trehalose-phosphate synthase (UDP-forming)/trehalose-phosphatase [Gemmatimonadales bacterium]